ncbi:DUF7331 family protein [Halococcus hamelinensis]|uniref:Uncharacterized protein n=1 Tax=Halococcus hamelinensis 100A6 TaxID=1132509 RepID=M0LUB1_9EURY|nr:hypothetical protein [Halococcus hamelinensis]EMA36758.1 hypothetical protein C447_14164 [Halococcus hamelinensis 100A6]
MSTTPHESAGSTDSTDSTADPPALTERIVAFEREDDAVVLYDEREHTAWLRSSGAVTVTDAR